MAEGVEMVIKETVRIQLGRQRKNHKSTASVSKRE